MLYLFLNFSGLAAKSRHPRAEGLPLSLGDVPVDRGTKGSAR